MTTLNTAVVVTPPVVIGGNFSGGGSGGSNGGSNNGNGGGIVLGVSTTTVPNASVTAFLNANSNSAIFDPRVITIGGQVLGANAFNFFRNLHLGSRGDDVIELQKKLIAKGYLNITVPTKYFGILTRKALIKWQITNKIRPSIGNFGPLSRGVMNKENGF